MFKLLLLPPELLKVHAQGYADLASQAWAQQLCTLKNRWLLYSLSAACLLLALIFGGMALLLWSALPLMDASHAWVLLALPLGFLALSGLCWAWAFSLRTQPMLADIKEQLQLDILMIQKAQTS